MSTGQRFYLKGIQEQEIDPDPDPDPDTEDAANRDRDRYRYRKDREGTIHITSNKVFDVRCSKTVKRRQR
jgi:hypothetical protein